jgi:hypothetical protein
MLRSMLRARSLANQQVVVNVCGVGGRRPYQLCTASRRPRSMASLRSLLHGEHHELGQNPDRAAGNQYEMRTYSINVRGLGAMSPLGLSIVALCASIIGICRSYNHKRPGRHMYGHDALQRSVDSHIAGNASGHSAQSMYGVRF